MAKAALWMVSMKDRSDSDMDAWISVFSTESKADEFIRKATEKFNQYGVLEDIEIYKDFGYTDDEMYLGWIDERYDY